MFDLDANGNGAIGGGAEQGFAIGFIGDVPPLNTALTITALGSGAFASTITSLPPSDFVPCFADGTTLWTKDGDKLVEDLRPGDQLISCPGNDFPTELATLLRVFRRRLSKIDLTANSKLRPIRILSGSLGEGLPKRDLLVSRQHKMLVRSKIAQRMFGSTEVLIPAIKLTELPGIFIEERIDSVEYFHLLFDEHKIIYAEGAPTESLYTGPEAVAGISPEARAEILELFPEIINLNYKPKPARFIPSNKQQKQLLFRHARNCKPLLTLQ